MKRLFCPLSLLLIACAPEDVSEEPTAEASTSSGTPASSGGDVPDEPPRADLGVTPPGVCEDLCATASACQGIASDDCLLQCTGELEAARETSEACGDEHEALLACSSGLSCEELGAHDAGEDGPCRLVAQQASIACATPSGEPSGVCSEFCGAAERCGLSDAQACQAACVEAQASAAVSGEACAWAQDQQFTCVAALDCDAMQAWMSSEDVSACPTDLDRACSGDQE